MKNIVTTLAISCITLSTLHAQETSPPQEKLTENVTLRDGTFYANHQVSGKIYHNGQWIDPVPVNPQDLTQQAPDTEAWLNDWWGQPSLEALLTHYNYPSVQAFLDDMYGPGYSLEQVVAMDGYSTFTPLSDEVFLSALLAFENGDIAMRNALMDRLSRPESLTTEQQRSALESILTTNGENRELIASFPNAAQLSQRIGGLMNHLATSENVPNLSGYDMTGIDLFLDESTSLPAFGITTAQLGQMGRIWGGSIAGMDVTGIDFSNRSFINVDFRNVTGLNAASLSNAEALVMSNFSGLDMTGFFPTDATLGYGNPLNGYYTTSGQGAPLYRADFSNTTGLTGANFNNVTSLHVTNLSGLNLIGLDPTGKNMSWINLSYTTGMTATQLAQAANLQGAILTGSGITKEALDAALLAAGKNPNAGVFNTGNMTF